MIAAFRLSGVTFSDTPPKDSKAWMWQAKNVCCFWLNTTSRYARREWRRRPENTQVRRRERVAVSQVSPR